MTDPEPTKYLVARITEALAQDERTNALDVQVLLSGGKVFILGRVSSSERRRAAEQVVREVLPPNTSLVNELCVQTFSEPTEPERVG
jgi:hypothetical protein